jgi:hypothetical protein
MVRRISMSVLSILALTFVAFASAEQTKTATKAKPPAVRQQDQTFLGEILSVDTKAHTFTVKSVEGGAAREMMFHVGNDSRVVIDGESTLLGSLERGERVSVEYRSEGSTHTATLVKRHKKTS